MARSNLCYFNQHPLATVGQKNYESGALHLLDTGLPSHDT
jgi:hypothetical protein